ncbi:hypothetical protein R1X32_11570 (plasmid) [Rhodococcus opacus]|uniref:electron transfer flavoprotein subunit beta/FixA family protein n=1 Tax=Rhodococcus opacus TaxID=37919 RepID=UPI0034D2E077
MKIVVPVRQVAQLHDEFEILDSSRVDPDYMEFELNEWDSFSLAAATGLASENADTEIIAVAVGGDDCDAVLREAVALGASRAVHIDVSGEPEPDVLQVGRLIAEFAYRHDADLVLCGVQSADAGAGATPSAVAGCLQWPRLTAVVEVESGGAGLSVRRELVGGTIEHLALDLPAVLAIQSGSYEVPYPTIKAKMAAKRTPIETLTPQDLLDDPSDFEWIRGSASLALAAKVSNTQAQALEGTPNDVALAIKKIIEEEHA